MVQTRSQRREAAQASPLNDNEGKDEKYSNGSDLPSSAQTEHRSNDSKGSDNAREQDIVKDDEVAKTPIITIVSMILIAAISVLTLPETLQPVGKPTVNHVWYFGWISALSTGLGVLPLIFSPDFNTYWVGVTNCKFTQFLYRSFVALFQMFVDTQFLFSATSFGHRQPLQPA